MLCVSKKTDRQEFKHKGECGAAEGRGRKCKTHKDTRREQATGTEKTEDQKTKNEKQKNREQEKKRSGTREWLTTRLAPAASLALF